LAVQDGRYDIVRCLISLGADVTLKSGNGQDVFSSITEEAFCEEMKV
jgi:hypothetical protein